MKVETNGLKFTKYTKKNQNGLQVKKLKSGLKIFLDGTLFAFIKYDTTPFAVTASDVEHNGKTKTRYMFGLSDKDAERLNIPLNDYSKGKAIVKSYVVELEKLFN